MNTHTDTSAPTLWLGLTRYQWIVLLAAWLGWGFDVFDALLFNYISSLCIPDLLHLDPTAPATKGAITLWTGVLTSELLFGWALGGIIFGKVTDRIGRTRTLVLTMVTYSLATAACAFSPNLYVLAAFRFIASLGIGGEWAAGASLVAETVPNEKRVLSGSLLYTSSPLGLLLATWVNDLFTRQITLTAADPSLAWRAVFATGIIPLFAALWIWRSVREPAHWRPAEKSPAVRELFAPDMWRRTAGALGMAGLALVTWWTFSAFLPAVARFLAEEVTPLPPPEKLAVLKTSFVTHATGFFNFAGFIGTLLTIPIATHLGRRPLFVGYFLASSLLLALALLLPLEPRSRLTLLGLSGLTVFGVFGAFPFYLPELFPMRLRGTGAGFTYNTGRIITAAGPFAVGMIAAAGVAPLQILKWVTLVPLAAISMVFLGFVDETKGKKLES